MKRSFIFLVSFFAGLEFLCPPVAEAQQAVDFTLKDLSGQAQRLSDNYSKGPVLLNFWATWCVPCAKELPYLQKLYDRYQNRGLRIFTINVDTPDRLALVSHFIGRYGYTLPVLLDTESKVVSLYNPRLVLPYSVLIDKSGRIRHAHQGYSPGDEKLLEQKILAVLAEHKVKPKAKISAHANESFLLRALNEESETNRLYGEYSEIINQLDLTVSGRGILVGARVDSSLDFSPLQQRSILAKRFAEYLTGGLRVRAGDYYHSLGRGLVLSLLKVFEEEGLEYVIDTTIDGGIVSIETGRLSAQVFGGWIDRPENNGIKDKIMGGTTGFRLQELGTVLFNYIQADLEPGSEFRNKSVSQGSLSLEFPEIGEKVRIYSEFSLLERRPYSAEKPISGHGLYLESALRLGNLSLLLEAKDYKELNFEYSRPPLLESEELDILADQFDVDRTDISGISARLDYFLPGSATLFYGKLLYLKDNPKQHPIYGSYERNIWHLFAGVEKKFQNGSYVNGLVGWREESDTSIAFSATDGRTIHDQLNTSWPIAHTLSLEADWKHKVFDGQYYHYSELRFQVSLHKSPLWVISLLFERTTHPAIVLFANKNNWWAGQVEVKLAGSHSLRLFVGSTKGSIKCAGGACQLFPPFEGLRLEAILRF